MTDEITEPTLRPCPFCGGTDLRIVGVVRCDTCGADGPLPSSISGLAGVQEAANRWNGRHDDVLLKRCDIVLETAEGVMGGEADNPEQAAWEVDVEAVRGEIAERLK